jgi:predicted phage terminase large subunit-like protein
MSGILSPAARLAALPEEQRSAVLAGMDTATLEALEHAWPFWARPDQLPPPGDWRTWLVLAGRGWGKTKTAAEWVRAQVESGKRRQIGIIGPTADALRRIQVEGPSGILACCPLADRPSFEPSTRRIVWPDGQVCHLFSAEEPDRLRGPNLDAAWCDEITSWANLESCWDMLNMALRLPGPQSDAPQMIVTTTPRPLPLLKAIMAASSTIITRGRTMDNAANLDASTLRYLQDRYGGTTLGRQELDGELLNDVEGALWNRAMLEECRVQAMPELKRIVVAIDPAGGAGRGNDETGIIVAGLGLDGHGYVLTDASGKYSPEGWARRAVDAYRSHRADRIVAEQNFGGSMVESTIRTIDQRVPIRMVHASRGKMVRAEPVVALYEQRKIHHVGNFPALEDQLCQWQPNAGMASPDRLDAMVWAFTELALGVQPRPTRFIHLNIMGR